MRHRLLVGHAITPMRCRRLRRRADLLVVGGDAGDLSSSSFAWRPAIAFGTVLAKSVPPHLAARRRCSARIVRRGTGSPAVPGTARPVAIVAGLDLSRHLPILASSLAAFDERGRAAAAGTARSMPA